MAVPFVDSLTTNLDHSLPLTVGEFDEFGNAKDNKEHFDYIYSYAPYNNIKKMDYPHILITTSLSDNRVLFDEPAKFTAKLRDYKTDNNLLLLKTEMNAGSPGKLVDLESTIKGFDAICKGEYDHLPEAAFYMVGTIEEVVEKAEKMAKEAAA